ncbi:acyl-CoA N-acyltransferase [Umbelopsis sp. PMI_123]|nr:acyl-CoA N-acyltransferase [Umbelopsis sp. PMI_123]
MAIDYQLATDDDLNTLVNIHVASWRYTYRGLVPDTYLDDEVEVERLAHWQEMLPFQDEDHYIMLALDQATGQVVGFVKCEYEPEKEKDMTYVDHLHVLPGWQGAGIGKTLLELAIDWTKAKGLNKIYLYVMEKNENAITFYSNRGWHHDLSLSLPMASYMMIDSRRYVKVLSENR